MNTSTVNRNPPLSSHMRHKSMDENQLFRGSPTCSSCEKADETRPSILSLRCQEIAKNSKKTEEEISDFLEEMKILENMVQKQQVTQKKLVWSNIRNVSRNSILSYEDIPNSVDYTSSKRLLEKLCVLKLNGGLGTTMGCFGPKSLIEVRKGDTFLDLVVEQQRSINKEYEVDIPLILMNSFNTHEETLNELEYKTKRNDSDVMIRCFEQSKFPRLDKETLLPVVKTLDDSNEFWYPPGHGNLFHSLLKSGLLDEMISLGKEYMFVSNIDNLGATIDLHIVMYMAANSVEYIMEVTDKTLADVKGGTLIEYEGKTKLLEIAQVPSEHINEFKSLKRFSIFNTNNIWINLKAMRSLLLSGEFENSMDVIFNPKIMNDGKEIVQLETAVGSAIQCFKTVRGMNVPRSRFLPVKVTNDLLLVQSDLFDIENGIPFLKEHRLDNLPLPLIRLGSSFRSISNYNDHFLGIPNINQLDHLTVSGNVVFGKNVVLKGTVIIVADNNKVIHIPDGTILENKVVSGHLNIVDHY